MIVQITLSLVLILLIFFQMPKDNIGLTSFSDKTNFLGSPTTAEKRIKIITAIGILLYVSLAFRSNINV